MKKKKYADGDFAKLARAIMHPTKRSESSRIRPMFEVRSVCSARMQNTFDQSHEAFLDYSEKLFHRWEGSICIEYHQKVCRYCGSLFVERVDQYPEGKAVRNLLKEDQDEMSVRHERKRRPKRRV